ncbi:hypothetical protein Q1695_001738 [Nippostrongylus brasiliensis]|nr:hypothetical protein Q1695_001738 [Nippostrongylus brasiliensis]
MVRPIPQRAAILELSKSGLRDVEIARILKVNRSTVYRAIQRGTMKDRVRPGRPVSAATPRLIEIVKKRIQRNAKRSMRKMARELNVSERTVRRVVKEKLGMYPYKLRKRHGLTDDQKKGRHEKCKGLLKRAANGGHLTTLFTDEKLFVVEQCFNVQNGGHLTTLFTDEKLFVVEQCFNVQNVRVLAQSSSDADKKGRNVSRNSKPASVMVWAGVTPTGRTSLVFVEKSVKINTDVYREEILEKHVLPWSRSHFGEQKWTFQQDGAPAHRARRTQDWCRANFPDFIPASEWPANSPDLNVMDFCVWSILEEKACAKSHASIEALKSSLKKAWEEIPQDVLRAAVDSYPDRLVAVVKNRGGHIE